MKLFMVSGLTAGFKDKFSRRESVVAAVLIGRAAYFSKLITASVAHADAPLVEPGWHR